MPLPKKYTALSKFLSYLLRHHPEDVDLSIDEKGWTDLQDVLDAMDETKHSWADIEDIERLIEEGEKQRFEIKDGKIRALYGHSIDVQIASTSEPPDILYHGTSPESLQTIIEQGLKPMGRQYVHLSKSKEDAFRVGKRHSAEPVLLEIKARRAHDEGIDFMDRGEVYLVKELSPEYLEVCEG